MIVLLSCTKKKKNYKCTAKEMYSESNLFKKAFGYAKTLTTEENIYILSAKHGLLRLNDVIEPYNITLNDKSSIERKKWTIRVLKQMGKEGIVHKQFCMLCGMNYRKYLMQKLNAFCPVQNLGIGKQMAFYTKKLTERG